MDLSTIKREIVPMIEELGFFLYDIEYIKEKRQELLRIAIDKDSGITVDECVLVLERIAPVIDKLNPLGGECQIEVTSPGAERKLRNKEEIKRALGKYVHVDTYEQKHEGILSDFNGETLTLKLAKNKEIKINYIDINLIRLAIKF
ncbi:MAG: ribosome maturation factor RimP [Acholeplasmataceae bacterium]|nr:ribosome maturation factor RimP [Acholeplasmataceae bacterium]